MQIGNPIAVVPNGSRVAKGDSKYRSAYEAAVAARGAWVPITFDTKHKAQICYNAAKQVSQRMGHFSGLEVTQRQNVVYLRMPQAFLGESMEPAQATTASEAP